jgi:hypothetical protein
MTPTLHGIHLDFASFFSIPVIYTFILMFYFVIKSRPLNVLLFLQNFFLGGGHGLIIMYGFVLVSLPFCVFLLHI